MTAIWGFQNDGVLLRKFWSASQKIFILMDFFNENSLLNKLFYLGLFELSVLIE